MKWRDAAAVILAARSSFGRSAASSPGVGYQVLTGQRSSKSSFLPEGFVYPGGVFEAQEDAGDQWTQLFKKLGFRNLKLESVVERYPGRLPVNKKKSELEVLDRRLSLRITAVRETFEECGVLLCRSPSEDSATRFGNSILVPPSSTEGSNESFFDLCDRLGCFPDVWSLVEGRNWLTPAFYPKRFDTVYYICCLDHMPLVNIDGAEISCFKWESPADYLAMHKAGQLNLPPPQIYEFHAMTKFDTLDGLQQAALSGHFCNDQCFLPIKHRMKDGAVVLLPGDDLYVESDSKEIFDYKDLTIEEFRGKAKKLHRFELSAKGKPSFLKNFD